VWPQVDRMHMCVAANCYGAISDCLRKSCDLVTPPLG
jgi:hypothetical protein